MALLIVNKYRWLETFAKSLHPVKIILGGKYNHSWNAINAAFVGLIKNIYFDAVIDKLCLHIYKADKDSGFRCWLKNKTKMHHKGCCNDLKIYLGVTGTEWSKHMTFQFLVSNIILIYSLIEEEKNS